MSATGPSPWLETSLLGQSASPGAVLVWIALLLGAVLAGAIVIFALRRRLLGDGSDAASAGLSLHELRQMHARGQLSVEEFEAAKATIIGAVSAMDPPRLNTVRTSTDGTMRAAPGFDLSGEPLPGFGPQRPGELPPTGGGERKE